MPKRRPRGRPALWDKERREPDAQHLWWMLCLAHGKPTIKYHQLAKENLYREQPLPGDELTHIKRLSKKLKDLLDRIDYVYIDGRRSKADDDKRLAARWYIETLMEPGSLVGVVSPEPLPRSTGIAWVPVDLN